MQHRASRLAVLSLLFGVGAFACFFEWTTERRLQQLDAERQAKEITIDRLLTSIGAIAAAQQSYADYGRHDIASFTRVSLLINRITTDAAGLRATGEAIGSAERLEDFWTSLSAVMGAESRASGHLAGGDDRAAADALLASSRHHVATLESSLRAFRAAEMENARATRRAATYRSWAALVAAAGLWLAGLVLFAFAPARVVATVASPTEAVHAPTATPTVDLAEAAVVASDLARLSDPSSLPEVLGRVAAILDARGVIIWMGAGDDLFAVAAHGVDPAVLRRIPSIARAADNATAAAWRTGALRTVHPDAGGYGAIVAPMLGRSGCVGVLAAEVRGDRENDPASQAVATIVASQLASVLAAWPAAGTTPIQTPALDRKAAAS